MPTNLNTVMAIEPVFTGHRFGYLQWSVEALLAIAERVVVVTASANRDDPRLQLLLTQDRVGAAFYDFESPRGGLKTLLHYNEYCWIKQIFRRLEKTERSSFEMLFIPYLDYICYLSPLLGCVSNAATSGILMTPHFHLRSEISFKSRIFNLVKRKAFERFLRLTTTSNPFSIDSLLVEHYSKHQKPLHYLHDPASFTLVAPCAAPQSAKTRVLIYGSMTLRKGVAQLLDAYTTPELRDKLSITIAGKQDEQTKQYIFNLMHTYPELRDELIIYNRFITADEEVALFKNTDIVWVCYANFYNMSGVMVQAGMARKAIVAAQYGLIGELTRKYQLGVTVDIKNRTEIIRALLALCAPEFAQRCGEHGFNLFKDHTVDQFKVTIAARLTSAFEGDIC